LGFIRGRKGDKSDEMREVMKEFRAEIPEIQSTNILREMTHITEKLNHLITFSLKSPS
jgi:acetolactate synthase small subunit